MELESLQKFNQEKLDIISKFDKNQLMVLIDSLTKKYYSDYVNGNIHKCKSTFNSIESIIYMFEDEMEYLNQYVNYSMLKHANFVLKTLYKHDYELDCFEMELESINPHYSLSASIRNSFKVKIDKVDKVNIKNLHDIVANDETIDESVVELVNALYDSFLAKDNDDGDE